MTEENRVIIKIGTLEELKQDARAFIHRKPESTTTRTIGMTPKGFAKVFSACRLELLHLLRHNPELTVQELAEKTGRHQEALSRDLSVLRSYELLPAGRGAKVSVPAILQIRA